VNLAATEWYDEQGLTWLETAQKIKLLRVTDARDPYPLSFDEQTRLFRELLRIPAKPATHSGRWRASIPIMPGRM
jgi:hypothetical protein